jgi:hypothetical protein
VVRHRSPAGRCVLLVTVLGSGLGVLDATVVNVALPAIGQDVRVRELLVDVTHDGEQRRDHRA